MDWPLVISQMGTLSIRVLYLLALGLRLLLLQDTKANALGVL